MEELYSTTDMYFACVLITLKYQLIDIVPVTGEQYKKSFLFEISENAEIPEDIYRRYYAKSLSIDARTFVEAVKEIKARLHNT